MKQVSFPNPFRSDGLWFKGNLHSHSTNSDGLLDLFQLSFLYRSSGYDFLFITDHNKLTDVSNVAKRFEDFLLLPGEEIDAGKSEVNTSYHLVALNLKDEIQLGEAPQRIVDGVLNQDGEVLLGHPYWSSLTANDLLRLEGYLGIEIFNSSCHLDIGKGYSTIHWDDLLVRGRFAFGFAVDDTHWHFNPHRPVDACYAWVMVKAKKLTVEALMESLKNGLFYSSNGPEILDVEASNESVNVKTSPVNAITFVADRSLGERFTAYAKPLTEATYKLRGEENYVRIEVEDREGRTAWTNPVIFQR